MGIQEEQQQQVVGDCSMQCTNHPDFKISSHGGICALCLQEKLAKLVSSAIFPSSPSPSFRSHFSGAAVQDSTPANDGHYQRRSRIPFPLTKKKKMIKKDLTNNNESASDNNKNIILKRSRSTAISSTHKRRFWSFFYNTATTKIKNPNNGGSFSNMEGNGITTTPPPFSMKVSRSRSVGCGSTSFSADFLDRISTGFGDCTLRRVESQREAKNSRSLAARAGGKNRVKCGGLFGGFAVISSSPSSSSSSYLISSSTTTDDSNENLKPVKTPMTVVRPANGHRRSRSWGWAFASPISFNKPSSKKESSAPNLSAIPSLLSATT